VMRTASADSASSAMTESDMSIGMRQSRTTRCRRCCQRWMSTVVPHRANGAPRIASTRCEATGALPAALWRRRPCAAACAHNGPN
jgi:hypothetical protein